MYHNTIKKISESQIYNLTQSESKASKTFGIILQYSLMCIFTLLCNIWKDVTYMYVIIDKINPIHVHIYFITQH